MYMMLLILVLKSKLLHVFLMYTGVNYKWVFFCGYFSQINLACCGIEYSSDSAGTRLGSGTYVACKKLLFSSLKYWNSVPFHSIPRSVPFRSIPFRSVLFCSVLFCSVLFCSVLFTALPCLANYRFYRYL